MTIKYLSTPIYYPNSVPHVGHLYSTLIVDIWKRACKLFEVPSYFTTGLDEHGQKVAQAATANGYSPLEHVNALSQDFIEFFQKYNIEWDFWVRTATRDHAQAVQAVWKLLKDKGYIYKGNYSGWYSISDETYLTQKPDEESDNIVWREEECYYFKLSAMEDKLKTFYRENPNFVYPKKRYNEAVGFLQQGLKDFVISRPRERLHWGVQVPDDEQHVIYVWVDALTNYISAVGYPDESYHNYWPGKHVLGKDILKFHAIYWPAMLLAADLPAPEQLLVHGWWLNGDAKISKSLGNAIPLDELVRKYQVDGIRYFLIKGIELGDDGEFREELVKSVVHSDLANKYGNIFLRMLGLIELQFGGKLPDEFNSVRNKETDALKKQVEKLQTSLEKFIEHPETINRYAETFLESIVMVNDYFQNHQVWGIEQKEQLAATLYFLMDIFKKITILVSPIMPETAQVVLKFLGYNEIHMKHFDTRLTRSFISERPMLFPKIS